MQLTYASLHHHIISMGYIRSTSEILMKCSVTNWTYLWPSFYTRMDFLFN